MTQMVAINYAKAASLVADSCKRCSARDCISAAGVRTVAAECADELRRSRRRRGRHGTNTLLITETPSRMADCFRT